MSYIHEIIIDVFTFKNNNYYDTVIYVQNVYIARKECNKINYYNECEWKCRTSTFLISFNPSLLSESCFTACR